MKEVGFPPRWDKPTDVWLAAGVINSGKGKVISAGEFGSATTRKRAIRYKIQSAAIFPIIVKGDTIGVFQILSERADEFNEEKSIQRLENFSEQIAIAVAMAKDRQRLKLLTTGLENTSNAIVIADREGLILWVNPAFEKLYGFSTLESLGKNAVDLVLVKQDTKFSKRIRAAIINKREWSGTLVTCRRDGFEIVSEATVTPILDELGQIDNFLIVSHDITERIKTQQSMLASAEARARAEKLASIGTMAAGISHEINQPLNSIKIISSGSLLLLEQGKEISAAECAESWTEISRQIDAISNIISHLRSVIRHDESGIEPCCINNAIEESLGLVGKQIASHDIIIEKRLQERLPLISAVSTGLEEVIVNLLVNAMQALDTIEKPNKKIVIRTCLANGVLLEISDNGPGINPAQLEKVFEPFFSTKLGGNNLGLGLAIANSIATSYNGTIEAASDGISGTTIRLAFPLIDLRGGGNV
jgi:PAS domain S-box-containing protein